MEESKVSKPYLIGWKQGQKQITKLKCVKLTKKESLKLPCVIPGNTIYVPKSSSGLSVIRQLRHAFCHNDLIYDETTNEYKINQTKRVCVAGKFSIDAIVEFVVVYLQSEKRNKRKQKNEN